MAFHTISEPENTYSRKQVIPTPKNKWARQTDPFGLVKPSEQPSSITPPPEAKKP